MQTPRSAVITMMEMTMPLHAGPYDRLESNDGKALASASTNDGTNDNNLDTSGNHGSSNHDFGKDHRRGGSEHLSKDDTPFSLPFP